MDTTDDTPQGPTDEAEDSVAETETDSEPTPESERDIPHNEDLQDPAGVGDELTHDEFNLGRSARIN